MLAQKYPEALRICDALLQKEPRNQLALEYKHMVMEQMQASQDGIDEEDDPNFRLQGPDMDEEEEEE
jgi:hypothetical protein